MGGGDAGGESGISQGGSDDRAVGRRSGASPWKGAGGRWKALVSVKMSGVMKIKMKEFRIGDFGICIGKRISAVGKVNRRGADRLSSMAKVMQGRVI